MQKNHNTVQKIIIDKVKYIGFPNLTEIGLLILNIHRENQNIIITQEVLLYNVFLFAWSIFVLICYFLDLSLMLHVLVFCEIFVK